MDPLVGTLILLGLALAGARLSFSTERVPQGPRLLLRTGTHFLLVGMLLGPVGLGVLTEEATRDLSPFLVLGLGWVGFHFGFQLDVRVLRGFPLRHHLLGIGQAVLTLLLFLGGATLLAAATGAEVPGALLLGAAAAACISTPAGIALVSANFLARGPVRDLLFFIASLDAAVGIAALQVAHLLYRPDPGSAALVAGWEPAFLAAAVGLGLACGIVFLWLTRERPRPEELVLFLLGGAAFAAGAAIEWHLSPLFVALVMGAVAANLASEPQRVFGVLERWEKPVYLIFLLMAGALLRIPTWWVLPLALLYALLRAAAKTAASGSLVAVLGLGGAVPRRFGLGLVPQGGIALAMAVSLWLTFPDVMAGGVNGTDLLFSIVVVGVMLSELVGPVLTVHLLRRSGEITAAVEEAISAGDDESAVRAALEGPEEEPPPSRSAQGGTE